MSRGLAANLIEAINQSRVYPLIVCDLTYTDTTLHLSTQSSNVTVNGITYTGMGDLLKISTFSDGLQTKARGAEITISGIPSANITETVSNIQTGSSNAVISCCFLDGPQGDVIGTVCLYSGFIDNPSILDDGKTCSITLPIENKILYCNRPINRFYTSCDTQMDLAERCAFYGLSGIAQDSAFNFVSTINGMDVRWGGVSFT